jgi:CheY-like chemotaxis protein
LRVSGFSRLWLTTTVCYNEPSVPDHSRTIPTVLLVDDDRSVHEALGLDLEGHFELVSALSGEAGLTELARRRIDVVLLDLLMPGIDGWQLFEHISSQGTPRPKVVFLTGVDSSAAAVAALRLGAEDWIVKPYDAAALIQQLTGTLAPKRIVLRGGSLGAHGTIAVASSVGCGLAVRYLASVAHRDSACEAVIDATRTDSEAGLAAVLRAPSNPNNTRSDFPLTPQQASAGVQAFTQVFRNGEQVWVLVRAGQIVNAGVNQPGAHY